MLFYSKECSSSNLKNRILWFWRYRGMAVLYNQKPVYMQLCRASGSVTVPRLRLLGQRPSRSQPLLGNGVSLILDIFSRTTGCEPAPKRSSGAEGKFSDCNAGVFDDDDYFIKTIFLTCTNRLFASVMLTASIRQKYNPEETFAFQFTSYIPACCSPSVKSATTCPRTL